MMKSIAEHLPAGFAATLATPFSSFAASITDATGRTVSGPDKITRVYPAGPPATVEIYTLAPDLLIGWIEPPTPEAREFLLPDIAARPQIPRLTGRGGVNIDALKSSTPDIIIDIGTVTDRIQNAGREGAAGLRHSLRPA